MQSLYLEKTNTSFFFWNAIKVRVESDKHFRTEIKVRRKWKEPYLLKKKKKTEFKNIILLKQDQMWKRFHFDQGSLAMLKKKKKSPSLFLPPLRPLLPLLISIACPMTHPTLICIKIATDTCSYSESLRWGLKVCISTSSQVMPLLQGHGHTGVTWPKYKLKVSFPTPSNGTSTEDPLLDCA